LEVTFNFFWLKINFLIFFYCFKILILKIKKNIILIIFQAKNNLKNNNYHIL